jgi:hypothetical protein
MSLPAAAAAMRRKAANRTNPWDLATEELLVPQDDDIPATKKPRHEEPFSASTDNAATKLSPRDTEVSLPADTAAAATDDVADGDFVKVTQTIDHWTTKEDAKQYSAVTNTCKKKHFEEYRTDWLPVAARVPDRTNVQCWRRWYDSMDPSIDRVNGPKDNWTVDEDSTLKDATQTYGTTTSLFPGRAQKQCNTTIWRDILDPSIDATGGSTDQWIEDEDIKLGNVLQTHGDKNWGAIAALVPSRVEKQCWTRWNYFLDLSIDRWSERTEIAVRNAVQRNGGKKWTTIAALVPSRTKMQCNDRWNNALDPSVDRTSGRTGKWTEDEDIKLGNAAQTFGDGDKDWVAISVYVPGRTRNQCWHKWYYALDPSVNRASERTGKWREDEDTTLMNAVQMHGYKDWGVIAPLVAGRTRKQCRNRWHIFFNT